MPVIIDGTLGVNAAAITTTNWSPTNLSIPGNATIGDASSDTLTINGASVTFAGTATRIKADFSNDTIANQAFFQTTIANTSTQLRAIPNGSGTQSGLFLYGSSDIDNNSWGAIRTVAGVDVRIQSHTTGTGTLLPITFMTGTSERLRIDTSGNLNLGGWTSVTGLRYLDVQNSDSTSSSGSIFRLITLNSAGSANTSVDMVKYKSGGFVINNNDSAGYVAINNAGSERVRITSSGAVGIGINNPAYGLDVWSSTFPSARINGSYVSSNKTFSSLVIGTTTSNQGAQFGHVYDSVTPANSYAHITPWGSSEGNAFSISTSGNIGIGLTNPTTKLTIAGAGASIRINDPSQSWFYITAQTSNNVLSIGGTGNTPPTSGAINIDSSGNVGVGTISPTSNGGASGRVMQIHHPDSGSWAVSHYTNGNTGSTAGDGLIVGMIGSEAYLYSYDATKTIISTAGATNMNLYGDGLVELPYGKIKFPASQSASSDPNTLDDYEEGTFTPVITFGGAIGSGSSAGIVYNYQTGIYTKIGNVVYFMIRIWLSNKGTASGAMYINGLPFPTGLTSGYLNRVFYGRNDSGTYQAFQCGKTDVSSYLWCNKFDGSVQVLASDMTNTSYFTISGTYETTN